MLSTIASTRSGLCCQRPQLVVVLALACVFACRERAAWQPPPPDPAPAAKEAPASEAEPPAEDLRPEARRPEPRRPEPLGPSRILGWRIYREAKDHLLVDVDYVLTGAEGTAIMVSVSALKGKYAVPYSVLPELASIGRHTARIYLGSQHDELPFTSDALRVTLYPGGGRPFTELVAPYEKTWSSAQ